LYSLDHLAFKLRLEELIHPPVEVEEDKLPVIKLTSAGDDLE